MSDYEASYLGQLRQLVGDRKLITPSVRAVIRDGLGRVLFVRRRDNGAWAMPASSLELDESVLDALKREVREETGLEVLSALPFAIYSEPRFAFTDAHGGEHQMLAIVFLVERWLGAVEQPTDETLEARFLDPYLLPRDIPDLYRETLRDLKAYESSGHFVLK